VGMTTGAARFYLGYVGQGVGKLVLFWVCCILSCIASGLGGAAKAGGAVGAVLGIFGAILGVIAGAGICAAGIWSIVDWAELAAGNTDDSDGYALKGW